MTFIWELEAILTPIDQLQQEELIVQLQQEGVQAPKETANDRVSVPSLGRRGSTALPATKTTSPQGAM